MTKALPNPGDTALLLLADMLDKVDLNHFKAGEPTYDQTAYFHPCGTPACAIGHWLFAEGRKTPYRCNIPQEEYRRLADIFELKNGREWGDLFGGWDRSAEQEAELIREFVKKRSKVKTEA
jgi:hypothetical protein